MKNIAVLVSGGGTNLKAIIDAIKNKVITNVRISIVISSKNGVYALEISKDNNIDTFVIDRKAYDTREAFSEAVSTKLDEYGIDIVVFAGFMCILDEKFVNKYRNRIINVHPALIPSFCGDGFYGLKVHEAVLSKGVKLTGATVHFVNEITDGGAIILQKAVNVLDGDTPEILQKRVMQEAEWDILPKAINLICNDMISVDNDKNIVCRKDSTNMECLNIKEELSDNSYPGRGIIIGKSEDGKNSVIAYFIMGRSENSRNRRFEFLEEGDMITKAFDESKLVDPSLIIYSPMRFLDNSIIITNGDQTDTIYEYIKNGKTFEEALITRHFEPDEPNYTPRISGIVEKNGNNFSYKLSILKSANGNPDAEYRYFYEYNNPIDGQGHLIHTYKGDGNPLPSFEGDPKLVAIPNDYKTFADDLWNSLNKENRVSLHVMYKSLEGHLTFSKTFNVNE